MLSYSCVKSPLISKAKLIGRNEFNHLIYILTFPHM